MCLLGRKPHIKASEAAWAAVETGTSEGMLAAHAVATIHYLIRKEKGNSSAKRVVSAILQVFTIAAIEIRKGSATILSVRLR